MSGYSARWNRLVQQVKPTVVDPVCWWCHCPIDMGLDRRHAMSHTFDHIIPRIHGGTDEVSNMANAHRSCNTKRSNQMQINGWSISNSKEW